MGRGALEGTGRADDAGGGEGGGRSADDRQQAQPGADEPVRPRPGRIRGRRRRPGGRGLPAAWRPGPSGRWRPGSLPRARKRPGKRGRKGLTRIRRGTPGWSPARRHVPDPPGTRAGNRWSGGRSPRPRERRPAVPRPPGRFQHAFLLTPRGSMADSAVEPTGHSFLESVLAYQARPGVPMATLAGIRAIFADLHLPGEFVTRPPARPRLNRMTGQYPHRVAHRRCCFAASLTVATSVSGMARESRLRLVPISYSSAIHDQLSCAAARPGLRSPFPPMGHLPAIAKFTVLITWRGI